MAEIKNINDARKALEAFRQADAAAMAAFKKDALAFSETGNRFRYLRVARGFLEATALLANAEVLGELLTEQGIAAAREGQNPFWPPLNALFRLKRADGTTDTDRSVWKWANCCRYFRDQGWARYGSAEEIADLIPNIEVKVGRRTVKKLQGAEMADRAKYREDVEDAALSKAAWDYVVNREGQHTLPADEVDIQAPEHGQVASAYMTYDERRQAWVIQGLLDGNPNGVSAKAEQRVRQAYRAHQEGTIEGYARQIAKPVAELDAELDDALRAAA